MTKTKKTEHDVRIISIINHKGGVGKTTSAVNLSYNIAELGYTVWLLDFDDSYNATTCLKVKPDEKTSTSYDLQMGRFNPEDLIKVQWPKLAKTSFFLIPSDRKLSAANAYKPGAEGTLKNNLDKLIRKCIKDDINIPDFVFIDSNPSLNLLTSMALMASKEIFIVMQCQYLSLEGMRLLINSIREIHRTSIHKPILSGIIATMDDGRVNLSKETIGKIRATNFKDILFENSIRYNISLAEAPSKGLPISLYRPNSTGAKDYTALASEIIKKTKGKKE